MIDANDPGTVAMPLSVSRGRGRPRKADALTPAQRAARYRARKAANRDVTLNQDIATIESLDRAYEQGVERGRSELREEVERLFDHIALMRLRKKALTVDQLRAWFASRSA